MFVFQEQVIKFANYLLSRKHAQSIKDAAALLFALDKLGNNPVSVFDNLHLNNFIARYLQVKCAWLLLPLQFAYVPCC